MKTPAFPIACFLIGATLACGANLEEQFDSMPIPGNRLPSLEQRVRRLEERLAAVEGPQAKNQRALAPAPGQSEYIQMGLQRADALLKGEDLAGAANAYQEILRESISRIQPTTQALTDTMATSCTLAMAAETLQEKGKGDLAKALNEAALSGLRRCREIKPEWNAKTMEYVLKKVEQRSAELR